MLAVVKKPHTNSSLFKIKGDIPVGVLKYLRREFGQDVEVIDEDISVEGLLAGKDRCRRSEVGKR